MSLRRADHSSRGVLPTVLRRCVWSRNIKNGCSIYIYDISHLRVNNYVTLRLLTNTLLSIKKLSNFQNSYFLCCCQSFWHKETYAQKCSQMPEKFNHAWAHNFFFCTTVPPVGLIFLEVSRSHTTTHHSRYDSSGRVISSSQRPLPDNTQHSQQTNIHAPGGIRTHDLSRRTAAYLRLRPHGHWDRLMNVKINKKSSFLCPDKFRWRKFNYRPFH